MKPFKKPGTRTIISIPDMQGDRAWFVEDSQYCKVAGPFKTEDEAYKARAALEGKE